MRARKFISILFGVFVKILPKVVKNTRATNYFCIYHSKLAKKVTFQPLFCLFVIKNHYLCPAFLAAQIKPSATICI